MIFHLADCNTSWLSSWLPFPDQNLGLLHITVRILKYYLVLSSQNPIKASHLIQSQSQNPYYVSQSLNNLAPIVLLTSWPPIHFFNAFCSSHTSLLLFLSTTHMLPFTVPSFIRSIVCHSPMKTEIFICFFHYYILSTKKYAWNIVGIQYLFIVRC